MLSVLQQYGLAPLPQALFWFTFVGVGVGGGFGLVGLGLLGSAPGAAMTLPARRKAKANALEKSILEGLSVFWVLEVSLKFSEGLVARNG